MSFEMYIQHIGVGEGLWAVFALIRSFISVDANCYEQL